MREDAPRASQTASAGSGKLVICLLGSFRVVAGSRLLGEDGWRLHKAKSLIKLLALAPNHRLLRDQVVAILWPDGVPETASSNFHRTLYVARRALGLTGASGLAYLHLQSDVLSLCPQTPCWIDIEAFEAAAANARLTHEPQSYRTALSLYSGDLLPEDRYEDWARPRRDALRQLHLALLTEIAALYEARGEHASAIEALQQVLANDPASETAHRSLMHLFALTGRRQQALRQYHALGEALRRELATDPDPHSESLYREIHGGRYPAGTTFTEAHLTVDAEMTALAAPARQTPPHNLYIQLTSFVGREREIADLKSLLAVNRLLTLTGVGGCGKTRLAFEVASGVVGTYANGVWLVELAALTDPTLVPQAVASALGVPEQADRPMIETLSAYFRSRELLLVLDNCEHLTVACAVLVETLLRMCPNLRVLATSREPLHIAGELIWRVPSLSLPDPQSLPPVELLMQFEAVRLFIERAAVVLPGYALSAQNAPAIAQVCYRLDGMPLAIELAAARVKVLPAEQIATRLDDCFTLLTGGSRTTMTRQQTLKATLDWSYLLLSAQEQRLLQRLAVFAGGCSLEAAEAVCAGDGIATAEVLDLLTQLVDRSLVVAEEHAGGARFRLLETIRQYARDRLLESGYTTNAQRRHAEWFLELTERAQTELWGPYQTSWLNQLEIEHDNLRAVLGRSLNSGASVGLRLAAALWQFWLLRGYFAEGRQWLSSILARASARTAQRPGALLGACALAVRSGDFYRAVELGEERLDVSRQLGDTVECAHALHDLGGLVGAMANYPRAKAYFEASLALTREIGLSLGTASVIHSTGIIAWCEGDSTQARTLLEESLTLFRGSAGHEGLSFPILNLGWVAIPHRAPGSVKMALWEETFMLFRQVSAHAAIGYVLSNLGNLARLDGNYRQARAHLEESLALFRTVGDTLGTSQVLGQLGRIATSEMDYGQARTLLEQSLALRRELGDRRSIGVTLGGLGTLAVAEGNYDQARMVMEEGLALLREMGDKPGMAGMLSNLGNLTTTEGNYDQARMHFEESLAYMREPHLQREVGLMLFNLGTVARLQHDRAAAQTYFEHGLTVFQELGARRGIAILLYELGRLDSDAGNHAAAHTRFTESLLLLQELHDQQSVAEVRAALTALDSAPAPTGIHSMHDRSQR